MKRDIAMEPQLPEGPVDALSVGIPSTPTFHRSQSAASLRRSKKRISSVGWVSLSGSSASEGLAVPLATFFCSTVR